MGFAPAFDFVPTLGPPIVQVVKSINVISNACPRPFLPFARPPKVRFAGDCDDARSEADSSSDEDDDDDAVSMLAFVPDVFLKDHLADRLMVHC